MNKQIGSTVKSGFRPFQQIKEGIQTFISYLNPPKYILTPPSLLLILLFLFQLILAFLVKSSLPGI